MTRNTINFFLSLAEMKLIVFGFESVQLFGVVDVHHLIEPVPIQAFARLQILYRISGWLKVDSSLFVISLYNEQAADQSM